MNRPDGVLLDIDGVIVVSWQPIPGAVEAVSQMRAAKIPMRFVTNTTSVSGAEVADRLRSVGVDLNDEELITAGVATAELLRREYPGTRCLVLNDGSMADLAALEVMDPDDPGSETADVVLIGAGGPSFTWERMNRALRALLDGAALVGMHGAARWETAEGSCLDAGAYLQMLAHAAEVEPVVAGKPAPAMFVGACMAMGIDVQAAMMVGDDVRNDVLAAQGIGMCGVLVRTGKFREEELARLGAQPDEVIDSLADLPRMLGLV